MFFFTYEGFIHDFVGFDGCFLNPETKSKEGQNGHFPKILDIQSPKLATNLPGLIKFLQA